MARRRNADARQAEFAAATESLQAHLGDIAADFGALAAGYFGALTEGKCYSRAPANVCFRLWMPGEPAARVDIYPAWDRVRRELSKDITIVEMIVQREPKRRSELTLLIRADGFELRRCYTRWLNEHLARLRPLLESFTADPLRAFTFADAHCSICGRALVDELSRARGVGPECWGSVCYYLEMAKGRLASAAPLGS